MTLNCSNDLLLPFFDFSRCFVNILQRQEDLCFLGTKFIFIRFNCDANREEHGAKTSFASTATQLESSMVQKTSLEHKIQALLLCIGTQIARIRNNENIELCEIVKLFYCKKCSNNGSDICLCPPKGPLVGVPQ